MGKPEKKKGSFFDLNIFGLKLSPSWGIAIGLVMAVLFYGSLVGSIGAVIFMIGIVKVIANTLKPKI